MKLISNHIRSITLGLAAATTLGATAQDISYSHALDIATEFFISRGLDVNAAPMQRAPGAPAAANGNSAYYIINTDGAFAVVAGDSRVTPILAYSLDNNLDTDNMAPGTEYMLQMYNNYINAMIAGTESPRTYSLPPLATGKELTTATWNQNPDPWWDKCPEVDGSQCVAGCVATAMSIVMRYHEWPSSTGFGPKKTYRSTTHGITSTADFANTDYRIASIPVNGRYSSVYYNWTDEQKDAVATLLFHAGVAADMDYSPTGSGATDMMALVGIANHFGYKLGGWAIKANYKTTEEYVLKLIDEINANRPMLYSGSSNGGGHMFVCDGYDTSYNMHFNMGWSGSGNGYYSILANTLEYSEGQSAVIGIIPDEQAATVRPDEIFFPMVGDVEPFNVTRPWNNRRILEVTANNVFNSTDASIDNVLFAFVIRDAGGTEKLRFLRSPATVAYNRFLYPNLSITLPDTYTFKEGDAIYLLYSTDGGTNWTEVKNYDDNNSYDLAQIFDASRAHLRMIEQNDECPGLNLPSGSSITDDGTNFLVNLGNICDYTPADFDGQVAIFLCDENDNQIQMVSDATELSLWAGFYYTGYNLNCRINAASTKLKAGYRLVAFCHTTGTEQWSIIDCDDNDKYYIPIPESLIPTTETVAFFGLFSTFCSDNDLDFSSINSFGAYAVRLVDSETLALDRLNELKAGVGALLMGHGGVDHYVACPDIMTTTGIAPAENLMVGVLEDTTVDNTDDDSGANYVFKTSPDIGFYLADNDIVAAGKAYMRIDDSPWGAPARFVFAPGDDANGIFSVIADPEADNAIYNLQGIKVTKPGRGIYIIAGKKVIIR